MEKETIGVIIFCIIMSFTAGFLLEKQLLFGSPPTKAEIADNLEYIMFEHKFPYDTYLNKLTLEDIRTKYRLYNMDDFIDIKAIRVARVALEQASLQICYGAGRRDKDWDLKKTNITGDDKTFREDMEKIVRCMQE